MNQTYTILDLGKKENTRKPFPASPRWLSTGPSDRKKVHLAGLGDVGGTVLIGLTLLGGDVISSLGIFDLKETACHRYEMELNQVRAPFEQTRTPETTILSEEELFDCDIFAFCIAKAVPAVGSQVSDVRMAQFEANRAIVAEYAKKASRAHFTGLFLVISDPVDLLCKAALLGSMEGPHPLHPEQIQGLGLGVMNARACYYAKKEDRFSSYLTEGRAFGPHGKDLVLANSIVKEHYDEECSLLLTDLTTKANLSIRELGYKPYIAPALSSAALTILSIIKGEWNYSANYLNGVYFGAKNKTTKDGICWEVLPLPEKLFHRLSVSYSHLKEIL
ncbi:MAG: lactate dehydrogenase [Lachnospiraceae bacterium]|nr:lactate dehydrogenase [Lachnospiraceae bacterium]